MKRRDAITGMAAFGLSMFVRPNVFGKQGQQIPLSLQRPAYPGLKEFQIDKPGEYVLPQDEVQREYFWTGNGMMRPSGGNMIDICCGKVEVDLGGHTLGADYGKAGVSLFVGMNLELARDFPATYSPASLDNRFVTLRNGTIDMARGEKTRAAVSFRGQWDRSSQQAIGRPTGPHQVAGEHITYERNEYHFENLKLLANDIAISVEGSHTVIRNCIIESADEAAIFIAGDNVTIENCEIRLRRYRREVINRPRAAIILRDGSKGVIRNNRIRIDDDEGTRAQTHCVVICDGARDVIVEGNTFVNFKGEPVKLLNGAQAVVRNNKADKAWL